MSRGRHAAPPDHAVARAVVGSTAAAGLASGGFFAITPGQVAAHRAALSEQTETTLPLPPVTPSSAVPASANTPAVRYTVVAGDTLSGIGVRAREPWQAIYADNRGTVGADPNLIRPGQTLLLDSGAPTVPMTAAMASTAAPAAVPAASTAAPAAAPAASTAAPAAPAAVGRHAAATGGQDIADEAHKYLGVPYVWAGSTTAGMDCSGLVLRVFADLGVQLPHSSLMQSQTGRPVASLADAQPGDLVFFYTPVSHVGIYIGGGLMIAAPEAGDVVKIQPVFQTPTAIRRLT